MCRIFAHGHHHRYTTIVSGEVFYVDDKPPYGPGSTPKDLHPARAVQPALMFHDFLRHVRPMPGELGGANIFFVEDVGYQKAAI